MTMSEIDDPVKAALAAMENAMSVAAVAVQWHAKAEKHRVEEKEKNIAAIVIENPRGEQE